MSDDFLHTQVAVVGAGPIGLELTVALQQSGVDHLLFESGQIGHTISWWPRETLFFSSPERIALAGVPIQTPNQQHLTGEQYLAYLRSLVEQFEVTVHAYEPVRHIERMEPHGFLLQTGHQGQSHSYHADAVVLATGGMHVPNLLSIPGEDLPYVSHYFDEPHRYFQQKLLVVGGRNSAIEAAMRCWRAGAEVTLSYRRPSLDRDRIKPALLADLDTVTREGRLQFLPGTTPVEIRSGEVQLAPTDDDGVRTTGETVCLAADFVLLLTGYRMDMTLFEQLGVELIGPERAPRYDPETMQTNVPGVYVAGVAVGGTQHNFTHFIETSHVHVPKIIRAITGKEYYLRTFFPSEDISETA